MRKMTVSAAPRKLAVVPDRRLMKPGFAISTFWVSSPLEVGVVASSTLLAVAWMLASGRTTAFIFRSTCCIVFGARSIHSEAGSARKYMAPHSRITVPKTSTPAPTASGRRCFLSQRTGGPSRKVKRTDTTIGSTSVLPILSAAIAARRKMPTSGQVN